MPATPARAHSSPGRREPGRSHADAAAAVAPTSPRPAALVAPTSPSPATVAGGNADSDDPRPLRSTATALASATPRPVERPYERLSQHTSSRAPRPQVEPLTPITATGGGIVAVIAVSLAAILDALISPGMGLLFGFVFVLSSVLVALRMCWYDAWAALALPPLVFIVAAGVAAQVAPVTSGGWLHRTSTDMAIAVLDHPVYLLLGTLLAAAAVLHRARVE